MNLKANFSEKFFWLTIQPHKSERTFLLSLVNTFLFLPCFFRTQREFCSRMMIWELQFIIIYWFCAFLIIVLISEQMGSLEEAAKAKESWCRWNHCSRPWIRGACNCSVGSIPNWFLFSCLMKYIEEQHLECPPCYEFISSEMQSSIFMFICVL
jgi:hypothetical protein